MREGASDNQNRLAGRAIEVGFGSIQLIKNELQLFYWQTELLLIYRKIKETNSAHLQGRERQQEQQRPKNTDRRARWPNDLFLSDIT